MTKINYLSDTSDIRVPFPGRPIRSEVVRENFQVLANAGSLWAYDTVVSVDTDNSTGDNLMTRSGSTVTVTCSDAHELQPGDQVRITGANGVTTDYNGLYTIVTTPSVLSFTYDLGGPTPNSPATGNVKVHHHNKVGITKGSYHISGTINHTFAGGISSELDLGTGGNIPDGFAVFLASGESFIAVLSINSGGITAWTKGAKSAGTPVAPAFPANQIPLCQVVVNYDSVLLGAGGVENSLTISEGALATLEGQAASSAVTVTLEDHGYLIGETIRVTDVAVVSGDAAATYEAGFHTVVAVPDKDTFTYSVGGPFVANSSATAQINDYMTDVRPLINLGGGGGGGGGNFWSDPVDSNIIPTGADNTFDLGSAAFKFKDGYFAGKLTVDGPILVNQNGAAFALSIDQNANATAVNIDKTAAGTGNCLRLNNSGTGDALEINQSGGGIAIMISSSATADPLIDLTPVTGNTRGDIAFGTARTADPSTPSTGDVWFNATDGVPKVYDGTDNLAMAYTGVKNVLLGTLVVDPPASGSPYGPITATVTVTGAASGDVAIVTPDSALEEDVFWVVRGITTDTVTVELVDLTGVGTDVPSHTINVMVFDLT